MSSQKEREELLTDASLLCGGALEAFVALAVVGARCVHAVAVHAGAAGALIHICKKKSLNHHLVTIIDSKLPGQATKAASRELDTINYRFHYRFPLGH